MPVYLTTEVRLQLTQHPRRLSSTQPSLITLWPTQPFSMRLRSTQPSRPKSSSPSLLQNLPTTQPFNVPHPILGNLTPEQLATLPPLLLLLLLYHRRRPLRFRLHLRLLLKSNPLPLPRRSGRHPRRPKEGNRIREWRTDGPRDQVLRIGYGRLSPCRWSRRAGRSAVCDERHVESKIRMSVVWVLRFLVLFLSWNLPRKMLVDEDTECGDLDRGRALGFRLLARNGGMELR